MSKKPKILLTNDDGIFAPGLRSLWEALHPLADITIIAPADDTSGAGVGITIKTPLRIDAVPWENGTSAWKVNGKPADCVKLGVGAILEESPDLIISGINRGTNSGRTVFYSGTVGGVIEGALRRIPGIAFSCDDITGPDYKAAQKHIVSIVKHTFEHPLPTGTILNVNFPDLTKPVYGIKLARQGLGYWIDNPDERIHPTEGTPYFWLGGKWEHHDEPQDSDVALLQKGYITAVPIHVEELTHQNMMRDHKELFEEKLNAFFSH
jgi:5'-nucleotidase